jgi:hypothetical protein
MDEAKVGICFCFDGMQVAQHSPEEFFSPIAPMQRLVFKNKISANVEKKHGAF